MSKPVYCTILCRYREEEVSYEGWFTINPEGQWFIQPSLVYDPDATSIPIMVEAVTMVYPANPNDKHITSVINIDPVEFTRGASDAFTKAMREAEAFRR